jgi:hypothetical protein
LTHHRHGEDVGHASPFAFAHAGAAADTVVYLDLPVRVCLPRLVRRTVHQIVRREELLNGNPKTLGVPSESGTR